MCQADVVFSFGNAFRFSAQAVQYLFCGTGLQSWNGLGPFWLLGSASFFC
jgi:hypothetical protein